MSIQKPRILFISETVTLAHFARPFELSNRLSEAQYEIHFACGKIYRHFLQNSNHIYHPINSISPDQFKNSLDKGEALYDYRTLKKYVEDDLDLINQVKPDLIVGDFRISLSVSARLAKVPYASICNAYWSPYAPKIYPVPCLSLTRLLGVSLGNWVFQWAAPIAFKLHALAMYRLYKHFGLSGMGLDLRQVYTEADFTLYADMPSLFPLIDPPDNHFFIGPILWAPPVSEPEWWSHLPKDRPIIYLSMGSSGSNQALNVILKALSAQRVTVIASTTIETTLYIKYSNIFTAPFLDGNSAAEIADLVICNGGSLSCQQAFSQGKPVLAIASNMDQFLNMTGVEGANAGVTLRSDNLSATNVVDAMETILSQTDNLINIKVLQNEVKELSNQQIFAGFVAQLLLNRH